MIFALNNLVVSHEKLYRYSGRRWPGRSAAAGQLQEGPATKMADTSALHPGNPMTLMGAIDPIANIAIVGTAPRP
jgi:hypothetical protein